MDKPLTQVVISKENAIFWMDENGRWCNRHGRFEHKKIIDYFHRAIEKDADGYFVFQVRGDVREKVYFSYAETPLFVFKVIFGNTLELVLNTGRRVTLSPEKLFVKNDRLYYQEKSALIKFTERTLMEISDLMVEKNSRLMIRIGRAHYPVKEITK